MKFRRVSSLVNPLSRLLHCQKAMIVETLIEGNIMVAKTAYISSLTEQDRFLTEEENQAMMENIAQTKFNMCLGFAH